MDEIPVSEPELMRLKSEVRDLRFAVKVIWTALILVAAYFSFRACMVTPYYERILEDMLGDLSKVPDSTRHFMAWRRAGAGLLAPGVVVALTVLSGMAPWILKNFRAAATVSLIGGGLLVVHAILCWHAALAPVMSVIQGLSGTE